MIRLLPFLLAASPILGCKSTETGGLALPFVSVGDVPSQEVATALSPLRFSGTILILTGAALLFVSRGSRGWIPLLIGVGLTVVLATIASIMSSDLFIYLLVGSMAVVAVLAVSNFKELRSWISSLHSSQSQADTSSPSPSEHGSEDHSSDS